MTQPHTQPHAADDLSFAGRVAIVTGAGGGLGRTHALVARGSSYAAQDAFRTGGEQEASDLSHVPAGRATHSGPKAHSHRPRGAVQSAGAAVAVSAGWGVVCIQRGR